MADTSSVFSMFSDLIVKCTGFDKEEIRRESRIADELAIDSLSLVEIAVRAEDTFGVRIDDSDADNFKTVGDAVDFLESRMEQKESK